jgi:macrolide transport system ATP-binding/permease protein
MEFVHRLLSWMRRNSNARDLQEEIELHLELKVQEKIAQGMSKEEARRHAQIDFGNANLAAERSRERWGFVQPEDICRDIAYGMRQFVRNPGFTAIVVITLALGIGATTAIFTLVQGLLERSLPVANPSSLYRIGDKDTCCYYGLGFERSDGDFDLFPYDVYLSLKQSSPEFDQLAAFEAGVSTQSVRWGSSPAQALRSEFVSGNYFATLGVAAFAGRALAQGDDKAGAAPVLVLSYATWQSIFGGDQGIVGATVYVEGHAFTVAGIAPPGFFGDRIADRPPDFWMPLSIEPVIDDPGANLWPQGDHDTAWLYLLGRVRPQTNIPALQSKLSATLRQWMSAHVAYTANGGAALIPRQHVVLTPGGGGVQQLQQQTGQALRILMILSCVVLLIASANFANLLLARGTSRRAQLAMCMALGATR